MPGWAGWGGLAAIGAFWTALVGLPLMAVLGRLERLDLLWDPGVLAVARVTAGQAVVSALVSALVGLPLGLWIGTLQGRWARWSEAVLALPFGVPSIVAAMSWVVLLGRSGLLAALLQKLGLPAEGLSEWIYSLRGVILAHVFFNAPWIALLVAQARRRIPGRQVEAGETLGAGRWSLFRFVLWPEVRWAFFSAAAQTLSYCVMSFALVLVLGGGPPVQTLETSLYGRIRFGTLDLAGAVACAVWELALTLLPWAAVLFFQRRVRSGELTAAESGDDGYPRRFRLTTAWALAACAVFTLPYLSVFAGALPGAASEAFRTEIQAPLWISARLALVTGAGALLLAILALLGLAQLRALGDRRGLLAAGAGAVVLLPGGMSALVLGLGLWLAYGRWIDPFAGSLLAMAALQITLFFPLAFRALWPLTQAMPRRRLEAALTLGASPWRAFWLVDWPRWRGPVASALGLVVAASISEVAAVSLFYSEELIPLPLLVSRWMAQYRFEEAQAVAALLFSLSMMAIILLRGLRAPGRRA
ncbi:MAG: ABC transporter permease subunit [Oligoflexia bacterium]|nr:ABC transporter permease subunit [Oligoflexia bacterium]